MDYDSLMGWEGDKVSFIVKQPNSSTPLPTQAINNDRSLTIEHV